MAEIHETEITTSDNSTKMVKRRSEIDSLKEDLLRSRQVKQLT